MPLIMASLETYIWTYGGAMKNTVGRPQSILVSRFQLTTLSLIGQFVRYGPNRLVVNSSNGMHGMQEE